MSDPSRTPVPLHVAGEASTALQAASLRALDSSTLSAFLASRRWYSAKGHATRDARITGVVPVHWAGGEAAVACVAVHLAGDASPVTYQMPVVVRRASATSDAPQAERVITTIVARDGPGVLLDATEDADFRAWLAAALRAPAAFQGDGARWLLEPVGEGPPVLDGLLSRVVRGEQSNTSIIFGDRAILKLFRRLEPGENPDVEITKFLTTRTGFRNVPELYATMHILGADDARCVSGALTRFLPNATDGWTYTVERARTYLGGEERSRNGGDAYTAEATRLGAVTRALHDALASDSSAEGFAVEPVTGHDVQEWTARARDTASSALDLLEARLGTLDRAVAPMARAIAGRRAAVLARLDDIAADARRSLSGEKRSRHHGDYHLGQVLRTANGEWMIIDFEGEPLRPLAERRMLASPLRDVAGMLRSFAYAAATAASETGGLGVNATVEVRAAHWERDARSAFLAAYGAEPGSALIALFELEKVFYELSYELHNRPAWAWIPLRGVAKLF